MDECCYIDCTANAGFISSEGSFLCMDHKGDQENCFVYKAELLSNTSLIEKKAADIRNKLLSSAEVASKELRSKKALIEELQARLHKTYYSIEKKIKEYLADPYISLAKLNMIAIPDSLITISVTFKLETILQDLQQKEENAAKKVEAIHDDIIVFSNHVTDLSSSASLQKITENSVQFNLVKSLYSTIDEENIINKYVVMLNNHYYELKIIESKTKVNEMLKYGQNFFEKDRNISTRVRCIYSISMNDIAYFYLDYTETTLEDAIKNKANFEEGYIIYFLRVVLDVIYLIKGVKYQTFYALEPKMISCTDVGLKINDFTFIKTPQSSKYMASEVIDSTRIKPSSALIFSAGFIALEMLGVDISGLNAKGLRLPLENKINNLNLSGDLKNLLKEMTKSQRDARIKISKLKESLIKF